MNKNRMYERTIGRVSVQKTLRFGLIPLDQTEKLLSEMDAIMRDEKRAKAYPVAKGVFDRWHAKLIENVLSTIEEQGIIDWAELEEAQDAYRRSRKDSRLKKRVDDVKKKMAAQISKVFTEHEDYKMLFGKNLFDDETLEHFGDVTEEEYNSVRCFNRFSVFFLNYYANREHMYAKEPKSGTIVYRIFENHEIYCSNRNVYRDVMESNPELEEIICREWLAAGEDAQVDFFEICGYSACLSQKGIDRMNRFVALYNAQCNLYCQQNERAFDDNNPLKSKRNRKLSVLHKQLLMQVEKRFVVRAFVSDAEVFDALDGVKQLMTKNAYLDVLNNVFSVIDDYDKANILIDREKLTNLSTLWLGKWDTIDKALRVLYREELETEANSARRPKKVRPEDIDKRMKEPYVSLDTIERAVDKLRALPVDVSADSIPGETLKEKLVAKSTEVSKRISECEEEYEAFVEEWNVEKSSLLETSTEAIKNYLDALLEIVHLVKVFYDGKQDISLGDIAFYATLSGAFEALKVVTDTYNLVRNYVTRKPYSEDKIHIKLDLPTLGDGWSKDKENDYGTIILRRNGKFYIGIMNALNKPRLSTTDVPSDNAFEKMEYYLFKDVSKMIPKCSTALNEVKDKMAAGANECVLRDGRFVSPLIITKDIFALSQNGKEGVKKWQKEYLKKTGDVEGYNEAVHQWIAFCYEFLTKYVSTSEYDYSGILPLEKYEHVSDFYAAADDLLYRMRWCYVKEEAINEAIAGGQLYLFQIYSKDYSDKRKNGSKKDLNTLYFEAAFSDTNQLERIVKLNGGAELFLRHASIKDPYAHKAGSILVNKHTEDGRTIPTDIYMTLCQYAAGKLDRLGEIEQAYWNNTHHSTRGFDLIKDKRYTKDHYEFHVPVTINYTAKGRTSANECAREAICEQEGINVIGLDRGERNLIAYTIVSPEGKIIKQGTFNTINGVDYKEKLQQREAEKGDARKRWKTIGSITQLKAGYLSQVVHQLASMMVEYNAIVVLEDLNFGFKKGRSFKVERQVYQKFEDALISKLNYLVTDKDELHATLPGGVLKGYQLTDKVDSVASVGKQCGFLFYVQPAYTSKIDPITGFADIFDMTKVTNAETRKNFIRRMENIFYDAERDMFGFSFDYDNFATHQTFAKKAWTVYTNGVRYVWNKERKQDDVKDMTADLKRLFEKYGVDWASSDLFDQILAISDERENAEFWSQLVFLFTLSLRMRCSKSGEMEDRIISPVLNDNGEFFATPEGSGEEFVKSHERDEVPMDADTNGAYHIALKGLMLVDKIKAGDDNLAISNEEWFAYRQKR